jgi:hypothetical protein
MAQDADRGGGRADNPYCKYCTDPTGNLKSKEEVREGMINFQMQQSPGKTREEVAAEVDQHMATMPAWQTQTQTPGEIQAPPIPETPPAGTPTGSAPVSPGETPTESAKPAPTEEQV